MFSLVLLGYLAQVPTAIVVVSCSLRQNVQFYFVKEKLLGELSPIKPFQLDTYTHFMATVWMHL